MESCDTRASLLSRVRDPADAEAWARFERLYGPLVLAYCRARGVQAGDAEDVRQMVMTKLMSSLRTFEYRAEAGGFRNYLRRVIRGELIRYRSRHTRGGSTVPIEEEVEADPAPDEVWEQEWMRHHFRLAWSTVRESVDAGSLDVFRQLLAGVSTSGVARSLGMTEAAVRKVKQRMSERLREAIAEQLRDEEEPDNPEAPPEVAPG
jgi:RNA polymerase sigma-70 factor (ECF subfamily)